MANYAFLANGVVNNSSTPGVKSRNSLLPGSAEYLPFYIDKNGLCSHKRKDRFFDRDHQGPAHPSRLGLFYSDKLRIYCLELKKLCTSCQKAVIPHGYNVWSMSSTEGSSRSKFDAPNSPRCFPPIFHSALANNQGVVIPIPEVPYAQEAWDWLSSQGKPFYIDQLHLLGGGWSPFTRIKAKEDSEIASRRGQVFDPSWRPGANAERTKSMIEDISEGPKVISRLSCSRGMAASTAGSLRTQTPCLAQTSNNRKSYTTNWIWQDPVPFDSPLKFAQVTDFLRLARSRDSSQASSDLYQALGEVIPGVMTQDPSWRPEGPSSDSHGMAMTASEVQTKRFPQRLVGPNSSERSAKETAALRSLSPTQSVEPCLNDAPVVTTPNINICTPRSPPPSSYEMQGGWQGLVQGFQMATVHHAIASIARKSILPREDSPDEHISGNMRPPIENEPPPKLKYQPDRVINKSRSRSEATANKRREPAVVDGKRKNPQKRNGVGDHQAREIRTTRDKKAMQTRQGRGKSPLKSRATPNARNENIGRRKLAGGTSTTNSNRLKGPKPRMVGTNTSLPKLYYPKGKEVRISYIASSRKLLHGSDICHAVLSNRDKLRGHLMGKQNKKVGFGTQKRRKDNAEHALEDHSDNSSEEQPAEKGRRGKSNDASDESSSEAEGNQRVKEASDDDATEDSAEEPQEDSEGDSERNSKEEAAETLENESESNSGKESDKDSDETSSKDPEEGLEENSEEESDDESAEQLDRESDEVSDLEPHQESDQASDQDIYMYSPENRGNRTYRGAGRR